MSDLRGSPRILKGALVTLEDTGKTHSTIYFQYNPDTLQRSLTTQSMGGAYGQPLELYGPPMETISFDAELDATDLTDGQSVTLAYGIHPALAALELLLYPESEKVTMDNQAAKDGFVAINPIAVPLTLLVWGPRRVLPVQLDSLTIKEESFDAELNPLRATVQLSLRVLSYIDLGLESKGGSIFMSHQKVKESLARDYAAGSPTISVTFPAPTRDGDTAKWTTPKSKGR